MSPNSKVTRLDVRKMMINKSQTRTVSEILEKLIAILLFVIASTAILITIGIVFTLLSETIEFFKRIPIWDFFTGTMLNPLSQDATFGILPLVVGTVVSSVIEIGRASCRERESMSVWGGPLSEDLRGVVF